MAVEHDHSGAETASGGDAEGNSEQRFREFISFFGSLVGLIGFGLGILPNSTTMEKFLVVIAAIALSCVVTLAIRLVPKGRSATWLAVFGVVSVACLAALSVVAQRTTVLAPVAANASAPRGGGAPSSTRSASSATASHENNGQSDSLPSMAGVLPSQKAGYSLTYRNFPFGMPGDSCQYGNIDNASYVSFTQDKLEPKVHDSDVNDGDMDINCGWNTATLIFNEQEAQVTGNPSAAQCAEAINVKPLSESIGFDQLRPGEKFCFVAGGGNPAGPLVLVTLKSVAGSPSFAMTWTATTWEMPSSS